MIKAVIFDMDGLMIDSERVTFECYQEVLKEMGLTDPICSGWEQSWRVVILEL